VDKSRMNVQITGRRDQRIQRASANVSLHKLNQLEDQVRVLSQIAGEQAQATQKLLRVNNDDDGVSTGTTAHPECASKIIRVSESQVQTSFCHDSVSETSSPLPSPPPRLPPEDILNNSRAHDILLLHLAVERWRTFILGMKFTESTDREITLKERMNQESQEAIENVHSQYESQCEQLQTALAEKEGNLVQMRNEISLLSNKHEQDTIILQKKRIRDIERVAQMAENELEKAHAEYQLRIDQDRHRADVAIKSCNARLRQVKAFGQDSRNEMEEIRQSLQDERNKSNALMRQLQSHQENAAQELKRVEQTQTQVSVDLAV